MASQADAARPDGPEGDGRARPRVVVGLDGEGDDRGTLTWALAAAARRRAGLEVVSVLPTGLTWAASTYAVDVPTEEGTRADAEARLEDLVEEVRRDPLLAAVPGAATVGVVISVAAGHPAAVLIRKSEGADLLAVGRRGRRPVRSAVLGSVALHCATHARCPVVIVHPAPAAPSGPTRVVAGIDGSDCSQEALTLAAAEAVGLGAGLEAVAAYTVVDYGLDLYGADLPTGEQLRADAERVARQQVDALTAEAGGAGRTGGAAPETVVVAAEGAAGDVLVERSRDAALLVVGGHGYGRFRGLLLGSVALHCAVFATCPVMIVRSGTTAHGTHPLPGEVPAPIEGPPGRDPGLPPLPG